VVIGVLIVARVIGQIVLPVYDDAFITFRYARNLAEGHGLVYHVNEWVLGATCPAFAIVLALPEMLKLSLPSTVVAMNIVCDALVLGVTMLVLAKAGRRLAAVLFGLFFALSPIATRICVGAMEMDLFLLCSVLSILLYHRGARTVAIILAALSYYIRPEAVLLVAVLCVTEFLSSGRAKSIWMAAVALIVVTPPALAIYAYYGHVLPQSVLTKSRDVGSALHMVIRNLLLNDVPCYVLLPFAVWGLLVAVRQGGFLRTCALWGVAYLGAYVVARPLTWSWYGGPVHYVQFIAAALGGVDLLGRLPRLGRQVSVARAAVAGGVVVVGTWLGVLAVMGPSPAMNRIYPPLREWCQRNGVADSSILAGDIGAIGYYSNARIYDIAGLVWPEALRYKSLADLARVYEPDYIFLVATQDDVAKMNEPPLRGLYKPVERFPDVADPATKFVVYNTTWKQEYVLFQKDAR
jgi:hypothetical protein